MASERTPEVDDDAEATRLAAAAAARTVTDAVAVRRIEGATYPLPPRTDEELEAMRAAYPDQAWFWTRAWYDGEREADAEQAAGQFERYYSDEEFGAALRARRHDAGHADV